jgi:phenylalanyl-tRNA synthetase beta chain
VRLPVRATARLIGVELDAAALGDLLLRMGHDVIALDADTLQVEVPAYRCDILHPRDLMEDAAIAYGYHNLVPVLVPTMTVGGERPVERTGRTVRETLTGIGFLEAMTLVLTCEERAYDALRLPRGEAHVQLENPISSEQTMLRVSVLPGLLDTLTVNAHRDYPQRLFEVGEVTAVTETAETGAEERRSVGGVVIGDKVGFTEARQGAEAVLRELGYAIRTANADHPTFLPGRSAAIFARRAGQDEVRVGRLGELHPEVLDAFKLRYPASTFEIDLTALTGEK